MRSTLLIVIFAAYLLVAGGPLNAESAFAGSKETMAYRPTAHEIAHGSGHDDDDNVFERMASGTRAFFARMNRALTWEKSPPKPKSVSNRRKATNNQPSGFGALFQPREPDPPGTVDEWLRLERPKTP